MKFKDQEINVLKNFATINPSMIIFNDGFKVINNSKSCLGFYKFQEAYDFAQYGVYDVPKLLTTIGMFKAPEIDVKDKYLLITEEDFSVRYLSTVQDILPVVPDVASKFAKVDLSMEFDISADKLNILFKAASVMKCENMFFESEKGKIRITVSDKLEPSNDSFNVTIDTGIKTNNLAAPIKIPVAELNLFPGDYSVKISDKITRWDNFIGTLHYFIGVSKA
jgi:hypothetical protein